MRKEESKEKCPACGKEFILSIERWPSKMDDKRDSYYCCPYCEKVVNNIRLMGNEEMRTCKIEKKLNL